MMVDDYKWVVLGGLDLVHYGSTRGNHYFRVFYLITYFQWNHRITINGEDILRI